MPPLHDVLIAIAGRPDAAGALVVSHEGLVIDAALPAGVEAETLAALAATAYRTLEALAAGVGEGTVHRVVLEADPGVVILHRLTAGATLLVLAAAEAELGDLLHDLRRHGPALAELV